MRIFSLRNFNPKDYWRVGISAKKEADPIPSPLEEFKPKEEIAPEETVKRKMEDMVEPAVKKKRSKVRLQW